MRDATIATSRTRATTDHLIDYRPLPAEWGDVEALHALRARRSAAAARGLDTSTLQLPALQDDRTPRPARTRTTRPRKHTSLASLLRAPGIHRTASPAHS